MCINTNISANTCKHPLKHTHTHSLFDTNTLDRQTHAYTHAYIHMDTCMHAHKHKHTHTHTHTPAVQWGAVQEEGGSQSRTSATPERRWAARQRMDSAGSSLHSRPEATAADTGPAPCPRLACTHSNERDCPWRQHLAWNEGKLIRKMTKIYKGIYVIHLSWSFEF